MSFYLQNIPDHRVFRRLLQRKALLLVRIGEAASSACQQLDRALGQIDKLVSRHVTLAAYETKDIPSGRLAAHLAPRKPEAAVAFFYQSQPVLLSFNGAAPVYLSDRIHEQETLLSLIILVLQSVSRNHQPVILSLPVAEEPAAPPDLQQRILAKYLFG